MKNPTASRPERGTPAPLGATMRVGGVNFSIYSHNAESVELVLFDKGASDSAKTLRLDPLSHPTTTGKSSCRACGRARNTATG